MIHFTDAFLDKVLFFPHVISGQNEKKFFTLVGYFFLSLAYPRSTVKKNNKNMNSGDIG